VTGRNPKGSTLPIRWCAVTFILSKTITAD
jgi:hypothetical protein